MHSSLARSLSLAPAACLALAALAVPGSAQSALVLEGDLVPGVGAVTRIDNLAINAQGVWLVEADTDNPNTDIDGVLLRNGVLLFQEGDPLAAPAGALLDSFDDLSLSPTGELGANFFLDGPPSGQDSGIYFEGNLVLQEGFVSTSPAFSAGTPYIGFFGTKVNGNDQMLVVASVDDPAIASTVDRALVILLHDGNGGLLSETVLWKEGDVLPGQVAPAADFETGPHEFDFNASGSVLFGLDTTAATNDGSIYLDSTLLAQEGAPSPVAGRNWLTLSSARVALNDAGDYVHTGRLDGDLATDTVIVKNGAVVVQEGDALPSIAPFQLTSIGTTSPVMLDAAGNVVWWGQWNDPDTTRDSGWFRNGQLVVQEGVTTVNGIVLQSLASVTDGAALGSGGALVFEGTLANGLDGAFLLDTAAVPFSYCTAKVNSLGCASSMGFSGTPSASSAAPFLLTATMVRNQQLGTLFYGFAPHAQPFQGGTLCVLPPVVRTSLQNSGGSSLPAADCSGSFSLDFNAVIQSGSNPNLVPGQDVYTQYWSRDPGDPFGTHLTDAVGFTIGA